MNDCFWYNANVCGCCDNCKKYISMNSVGGDILCTVYQKDIDKALEPVTAAWKVKFEEYKIEEE